VGSFYDDYEGDCIELWDDIEELQKKVRMLERQVKILMQMNSKVEVTV